MTEQYFVPEYNPKKFKKAAQISLCISRLCILIMCLANAWIIGTAIFDRNAFVVIVNGVSYKHWPAVLGALSAVLAVFGLLSTFSCILHFRFEEINAIYSEPDPDKRLRMCLNEKGREELDQSASSNVEEYKAEEDNKD